MSPHIVLWPETAIPFYIQDDRAYLTKLRSMAKERRINLILGLPRYDTHFNAYNSALFISSSGEILGWQDKRRLVPFGEYIPFRPMLIPLFKRFKGLEYALLMQKDFIAGGLGEPIVTPAGKIGVGVCSDSFFPDVFKGFDDRGVDYFFIITNDAWFYPSAASRLHILGSILRAVEFRRYVSQCANRGISAVIDSYGRIIGEAGAGQEKIINAKIYKVEGKTIYSQWGEWFRTGCLLILLMYGLLRIFKRI
jgi:apolipoprotein N-acyltransferase